MTRNGLSCQVCIYPILMQYFNANLSGLDEIKQFSMKEESTFHLPSKTFNEMYSFDKPLGMHSQEIVYRRSNCNGDFIDFFFLQGIIFPDGNLWKEQRKFAMKTLKQLGLGKNSLEHHIEVKAPDYRCRWSNSYCRLHTSAAAICL